MYEPEIKIHWSIYFWSTKPTTVPAGSDHYFFKQIVRPSQNFQIKRQSLPAEWIIDDSCLVHVIFFARYVAHYSSIIQRGDIEK